MMTLFTSYELKFWKQVFGYEVMTGHEWSQTDLGGQAAEHGQLYDYLHEQG